MRHCAVPVLLALPGTEGVRTEAFPGLAAEESARMLTVAEKSFVAKKAEPEAAGFDLRLLDARLPGRPARRHPLPDRFLEEGVL